MEACSDTWLHPKTGRENRRCICPIAAVSGQRVVEWRFPHANIDAPVPSAMPVTGSSSIRKAAECERP